MRKVRKDLSLAASEAYLTKYDDLHQAEYPDHQVPILNRRDINVFQSYVVYAKEKIDKMDQENKKKDDKEEATQGDVNMEQSVEDTGLEPWCVAQASHGQDVWTEKYLLRSLPAPNGPDTMHLDPPHVTAPASATTQPTLCEYAPEHPACRKLAALFKHHNPAPPYYDMTPSTAFRLREPPLDNCCDYAPHKE